MAERRIPVPVETSEEDSAPRSLQKPRTLLKLHEISSLQRLRNSHWGSTLLYITKQPFTNVLVDAPAWEVYPILLRRCGRGPVPGGQVRVEFLHGRSNQHKIHVRDMFSTPWSWTPICKDPAVLIRESHREDIVLSIFLDNAADYFN